MVSRTVTTKEELQKAYDDKADEIIVKGKLAKKMKKTRKLKYVGSATIAGLGGAIAVASAGIASTPVTGVVGIAASSAAITTISAGTGLSVAAVIIAVPIGIMLLVHIFKEYDEVEVGYKDAWMKLRRRGVSEERDG